MKKICLVLILLSFSYINSFTQATIGSFGKFWQPKKLLNIEYVDTIMFFKPVTANVSIDYTDKTTEVIKYIYGHNALVYAGKMNMDPVVLTYLNDLKPAVLRWPGGDNTSRYFWNTSVRPNDIPKSIAFWGGGKNWGQTWAASLDDFYDLLKKTNSTGNICVNLSYARYGTGPDPVHSAAHYAANWVRYDKGRSEFWELGNENYGIWEDGFEIDTSLSKNHQPRFITGKLYGQIGSIFIDSMRAAAKETGFDIKIGASAMGVNNPPMKADDWNSGMLSYLANKADFFVIHHYYTPYNENSTYSTILNSPSQTTTLVNYMNTCLKNAGHGPMPIALTDWYIFARGSGQAVSYINGMQIALNVGEMIKNKCVMSTPWAMVGGNYENGNDLGLFSSPDEKNVSHRNPHTQFYYLYYFQKCFGDQMINSMVVGDTQVVAYASSFQTGQCGLILFNKSKQEQIVNVNMQHFKIGNRYYFYTLTGGTDNGNFSPKVYVNGLGPSYPAGGPANYAQLKSYGHTTKNGIQLAMPPLSVVYTIIESEKPVDK